MLVQRVDQVMTTREWFLMFCFKESIAVVWGVGKLDTATAERGDRRLRWVPLATLLLVLCGDGAKTEMAYRAPSKPLAEPEYLSRKPGCG